jgi:hypothetical protein
VLAAVFGLVAQALPAREASPTRWSLEAGYSRRFFEDAPGDTEEQREYQDGARAGGHLGADVSVYPLGGRLGLGVAYSRFKRTLNDSVLYPDLVRGSTRDVYAIHYVAPSVFYRQSLPASLELVAQAGAGWMYYHNQHEARFYPGVIEGVALGLHGGLSLDYRPFRFMGVGAGARFLYGELENVDYNAARTPLPAISLTRFDLFAGVRFYP